MGLKVKGAGQGRVQCVGWDRVHGEVRSSECSNDQRECASVCVPVDRGWGCMCIC